MPLATTRLIDSSSATCQPTSTASFGMPPPSSGLGARRVQITNPSGDGSPEATPSWNGWSESLTFCFAILARDDQTAATARELETAGNWRRLKGMDEYF